MSGVDDLIIYGSWVRDRVLGCGGFGIVTLWKNTVNNHYLALKKCRWDNAGANKEIISKKQKERWSKEVDIMKRLSHRNVVRSLPLPDEFRSMKSELPILSMEFCSLGDLRQVLNKPENCCGLQEIEVRQIIMDIKNAIAYLHSQKITHRDLKPENIVLQPDENTPGCVIYKLIDLGYAKELDQSSICNSFVGTLQYLAPELFLNTQYTSSVDYWSLGLVSHEVITGVRPFLPNMLPVEWMMHVEKKQSDVICAYQRAEDNSIVFKKELFKENHISDYLRVQLEKWLMTALEWNPNRRGKVNNELVIFNMIDNIFNKKIVVVFCVKLYKKLSYEVDSATAVSTLKTWIERDANQPVSEQLFLLPTGEILSDNKFAISCWDPAVQDVMLYVLPTVGFNLPRDVSPYFPELVLFLLKNGKNSVEYSLKRRMWANSIYFIYQELILYKCFLDAYAVKVSWLVSIDKKLSKMFQDSCSNLEKLKATFNIVEQSLNYDQKFFAPLITAVSKKFPQQYQNFIHFERIVAIHAEKLKEELNFQCGLEKTISSIGQEINTMKKKFAILQMFLEPSRTKLPEMKNALKGGYRSYANLLISKKREHIIAASSSSSSSSDLHEQLKKSNTLDMFKITYNFLKVRDKALNDEAFIKHLSELNSCEFCLINLESQLKSLSVEIKSCTQRIIDLQLKRQQELWTLITMLSCNQIHSQLQPTQSQIAPAVSNGIHTRVINNSAEVSNITVTDVSKKSLVNNNTARTQDILPQQATKADFSYSIPCYNAASMFNNNNNTDIINNYTDITDRQPLMPVSSASSNSVTQISTTTTPANTTAGLDSSVIFFENERLRCDFMEYMTGAYEKMQSIITETSSMDWNSLCTDNSFQPSA
ncbi:inhibitor of nuclear factor kappa B kinase subunit beta isoform X2 [Lycorma delicatula]|uniref:inhibitor of nuclear factor kappa B kinase subunit beta isoform X2 n=1 Tax=Lycorma delicatula TaxID=130591 RepID=UPI003F5191D0